MAWFVLWIVTSAFISMLAVGLTVENYSTTAEEVQHATSACAGVNGQLVRFTTKQVHCDVNANIVTLSIK
jgi:hypothetical protein